MHFWSERGEMTLVCQGRKNLPFQRRNMANYSCFLKNQIDLRIIYYVGN